MINTLFVYSSSLSPFSALTLPWLAAYSTLIFIVSLFYVSRRYRSSEGTVAKVSLRWSNLLRLFIIFTLQAYISAFYFSSYTVLLGYAHFSLGLPSIHILIIVLAVVLLLMRFLTSGGLGVTPIAADVSILLYLLALWFVFLFSVNNIFSFILIIELLTITLYSLAAGSIIMLISQRILVLQESALSSAQPLYFLLLFFWSSTVVSVLLFFILTLQSTFILNFNYTSLDLCFIFDLTMGQLVGTLFSLIILFKLGMPFFYVWKFTFFSHSSLPFITIYVNLFFFILVFYLLKVFTIVFCTPLLGGWVFSSLTILALLGFFLISMQNLSVKYFTVSSSVINFNIILLLHLDPSIGTFDSILYTLFISFFILYNTSMLTFLYIFYSDKPSLVFFNQFKYTSTRTRRVAFWLLLSLAGLPLLGTFFLKFALMSFIWNSQVGLFFIVLISFLFIAVFFYFPTIQSLLYNYTATPLFRFYDFTTLSLRGTSIHAVSRLSQIYAVLLALFSILFLEDVILFSLL